MSREVRARRVWKAVYRYLTFFLLVAFVTTCCMSLFLTALTASMDLTLTAENLNTAAKLTFGNVLLLSFLFALIDALRRRLTVRLPARRIAEAAEKIVQGDFTARVRPPSRFAADESFLDIIDCFNRMAQELQGVETLRTDFIANVSHEMKTPLAVMRNYGTLLQTPELPEEKRLEYARGVTEGARRMADMMTNILKLNRLENQKIFPAGEPFDLGEQLCECLLQYENVWEAAEIEIETDIAPDVTVQADSELLSLVWTNLFSNAFKFTPPGGTVSVSLTADGDTACVCVRDTGCGMSNEVGAHIFEKFYQGDPSRAAQGNGLGLALVKRMVDILQGEIAVESAVGRGSAFTVKIRRGLS